MSSPEEGQPLIKSHVFKIIKMPLGIVVYKVYMFNLARGGGDFLSFCSFQPLAIFSKSNFLRGCFIFFLLYFSTFLSPFSYLQGIFWPSYLSNMILYYSSPRKPSSLQKTTFSSYYYPP